MGDQETRAVAFRLADAHARGAGALWHLTIILFRDSIPEAATATDSRSAAWRS
ncbi:hypothetical protein [Streptomyces sp. SD15]